MDMAVVDQAEGAAVAQRGATGDGVRWITVIRHVACILALMWTGIVNGQPFFFADTTNYIRAADMAVHLASGRTLSTVWTERYRDSLPTAGAKPAPVAPSAEAHHAPTANDLKTGLVMSGRSPYIGALMYAGWVLGWFWPFVLFQAAVAYCLIILALRRFGMDSARIVTAVTLGLAFTTALPTYNSLLLADGFASFGVLSFALLVLPGRLSRWQIAFLVGIMVISTTAHLTHLMMLLGMIGMVVLLRLAGLLRPPARGWYAAAGTVVVALLALQATAIATRIAVGREPQLLPLLTARFYMDGPGRQFVESGCDGNRFQVCRITIRHPVNNAGWLFDLNPDHGAYMLATPEERRIMGEEDVAFATAVLRAYPLDQIAAALRNTGRQLLWIDYTGLNQGCAGQPRCWENLPPVVHDRFDRSLSGRNAWPEGVLNAILYAAVIASLLALAVALPGLAKRDRAAFVQMRNLLLVTGTGMLVCCFFGGAVADPQYRYQGRLIWLVALFAVIATLRWRHGPVAEATA